MRWDSSCVLDYNPSLIPNTPVGLSTLLGFILVRVGRRGGKRVFGSALSWGTWSVEIVETGRRPAVRGTRRGK